MTRQNLPEEGEILPFLRRKDYVFIRQLGSGGCGETVLLHDDQIDEYFVCKKYRPNQPEFTTILFDKFRTEIKLMHKLFHPNVVRIFGYFLYPSHHQGYILMEYINGCSIDKYLDVVPDKINDLFLQALEGFCHLHDVGVIHRDIRVANLMVTNNGQLKIIDFGFSKQITSQADFKRSLHLNWPAASPQEFSQLLYDFSTDIYFLGQLFKFLVSSVGVELFHYDETLQKMCEADPTKRFVTFQDALDSTRSDHFAATDFSSDEKVDYQAFSEALFRCILEIEEKTKYNLSPKKLSDQLSAVYKSVSLEKVIPDCKCVISCFLIGSCKYQNSNFPVDVLFRFIKLFNRVSEDKRHVLIANINSKLDAIPRYDKNQDFDSIPF